ncbi:cobalamin biosynthesis protein CobQ [Desulfosporosinus sp.]|uniref:cobalamin biosynthesis protein CobQ n=1 Tax=Desulfosporosinus sp. TaxID=157907 RepID=UPI00262E156E|nr:cobalamin biosynthesis protein CobQ [Desulfosporosinus sp.]
MLLYLASNLNLDLFDFIQDEAIPVKKLPGEFNFKKFVIRDMRNFSHIRYVAIDHQALNDTDEELVEGILGFQAMYDARIFYLAEGMKPGDELLSKLYDAGVRNFITARDPEAIKREIMGCISQEGMSLESADRFKRQLIEEVSTKGKRRKAKAEPAKPIPEKELLSAKKVIKANDKVKLDTEKISKGLTIGVAGVDEKTGTTIAALNLACFLSKLGAKVSYIECDPLKQLNWLTSYNVNIEEENIEYMGVHFHTVKDKVILTDYDFNVLDLGQILDSAQNMNAFKLSEIGVLTATVKSFKSKTLDKVLDELKDKPHLICSFTSDDEREIIRKLVNNLDKVFFRSNSPDLFDSIPDRKIWKNIMRDYLVEMSINNLDSSVGDKNTGMMISSVIKNLFELPVDIKRKSFIKVDTWLIKSELKWREEKTSKANEKTEIGPMKGLMGQVIWVWANDGGRNTTYTVSLLAKALAESISVLIIDGSFDHPRLKQHYDCSKPGWERSWLNKTPGMSPKHVFTKGNLTVWPLLEPLEVDQSLFADMWNVALYHHKSSQQLIIVDGGNYPPPEGSDINLCLGGSPEELDAKTIVITENMSRDTRTIIDLLLQKASCTEEEWSC